MPQDFTAPVLSNIDLGHRNFLLEFAAADVASATEPGQFFMIGIPHADILLRRPFSVCGVPGTFDESEAGRLQVLYKCVGAGTDLLATLKEGARLHVLGPLGRGFSMPDSPRSRPLLVAGGIGSAPFPALARSFLAAGIIPRMIYGARSAADLPLLDWFRKSCSDVLVTTDDGSHGTKGLVTAPLADLLAADGKDTIVYACGPEPMLRAVARLTIGAGVPCELSLEAHMACGFGVCLGCVVPTRTGPSGDTGYERVCVEGPVMRAERLAW